MTIASFQDELIGPRVNAPEGPYTGGLQPGFKIGDVLGGDAEAEFVFLLFDATAGQVVNQGDALCWDNSYRAVLTGSVAVALQYPVGTSVGTFFCGGRVGDPAAAPAPGSVWSVTFVQAGTYGIWVQRAGTSLLKTGTITSQATPPVTNPSQPGSIGFVAGALHSNSVQNIESCLQSLVFQATTTVGSPTLSAISSSQFLVKGQTLSGAGIPNGAVIIDVGGGTVTMSKVATAGGAGVSITAANGSAWVTTTNGSPILMGVTSIAGLYPNQIVTGAGIAAGSVILKIEGNSAPYKITLSLPATATAASVNMTVAAPTNAAPNYLEAFVRWPQFAGPTT